MSVKLLTEHNLEFLSLKGVYTGSYESTLIKMPHCLKSYVTAKVSNLPHSYSSVLSIQSTEPHVVASWDGRVSYISFVALT